MVDMTQFYKNYEKVTPYLVNDEPRPAQERLQSPEDREKLDGLTSVSCVLVVLLRVRLFGGTLINSSARRGSYKLIDSLQTVVILQLPNVLRI